ncbi:ribosomal protection-like ABC-F family protein [Nitratifractor salsuginis]|uniref:ABC transporter related protein n=1 Tax=Nitratifractor salsuginis (strain DSM 16511 / JCM 12458 / E9I37-1) TaxID=749222 RepID=E6X081_NITSE|nr:ATP-binding cassette domain-containing protein [Nitratifractor salsuginis]ADV45670.1 ABC transporter related protein [Nitratifractor salsuginis DSM 16511]
MAYIDLYDIHKNYDVKQIFSGMEFHLEPGERVAIVGPNGCGKSTLLKIAAGLEEPDEGKRVVDRSVEFGLLAQQPRFDTGLTTRDAIEAQLTELKAAQERYQHLSEAIATRPDDKALLREHAEVAAYLDHHNAWNLDAKIERVLQEFQLKTYEHRLVSTLSGGEQRRVALAGLILRRPDVLMLDEPTNHLDVYMVEFLEEVLLKEKFTLLFISHDRYFIDRIATRIVEVEKHRLVSYKGGYQSYLEQKERRLAALQKEHENLLRLLKKEEEWLSRGVQARQTRNQGRKARVFELREKAKENPFLIRKLRVELEREKRSWKGEKTLAKKKVLFEIEDLHYSIAGRRLIDGFATRILQRDKLAIVGPNGSGKSTLLKLLLGRLQPESGTIKRGVEISIGYFDQHREMLKDDATLIETFCPDGGDRVQVMGRNMHVYGYLRSFLFPREYLDKRVGQLSGGEKNRVALALLFTKHYDCLILDEPTNDLDIQTINVLEEKLLAYQGAVLFVSHDRYFVDKIAQKLLILRGDGTVEESHQSYTEYLELEKEIGQLEAMEREIETAPREEPKRERKRSVKLSYKEQRDLELLPPRIEELEARIDELNACLADPECYNQKGLSTVSEELAKAEEEYGILSDRYLGLLEKLEEMEQN